MTITLSPELFQHFAQSPNGPLWDVPDLARDTRHPLFADLQRFLASLPGKDINKARNDPMAKMYGPSESEEGVRELAGIQYLDREIPRRRIIELTRPGIRPAPYDRPELMDITLDEDALVPVSEFRYEVSVLERNGRAFMMAPSTSSPNAQYWFLKQVANHRLAKALAVRLDPFMHGPAEAYPKMGYYMWVYGQPLDWTRLANLTGAEHGRWVPERASADYAYTDFVWDPRPDGIHLVFEEVPTEGNCNTRAARYLHAIYNPSNGQLTHFDGALRVYDEGSLRVRNRNHVRRAGKIGKRVKLFRLTQTIARECFADLAASFFVWNEDVQSYFRPG